MERETINRYITNFRRFISPYTRRDVSVKATAYPYVEGAVMVFEMNFNASSNTEYKSESGTMQEALRKTNLFDKPDEASTVTSTRIVWEGNTVIVLKGKSTDLWDERAAKNDVDNLLKSIEEKYRHNGQD